MIDYNSSINNSSRYVTTKFTYPRNPYLISDDWIYPHIQKLNYRKNKSVLYYTFETFAWHPKFPNKLAIGDRGTVVDFMAYELVPFIVSLDEYGCTDYYRASMRTFGGVYLLHVLVAETFVPNPNPQLYNIVNHKDGIKFHNFAWNLEWITQSMNMQHYELTLKKERTIHDYTIDEKRQILNLMAQGYTTAQIAKEMNLNVPFSAFKNTISSVRIHRAWNDLRNEMGLTFEKKIRSDESVIAILDVMEAHPEYIAKQVAEAVGEPYNASFSSLLSDLRNGSRYAHLLKGRNLKGKTISPATADQICNLLDQGYDQHYIAKALNLPDDQKLYFSIYALEHGASFKNITRKYKHFANYDPQFDPNL